MKGKLIGGFFGVLSVLALSAASSYAVVFCCDAGTVTATSSGFAYTTGALSSGLRGVTLTCADDPNPFGSDWDMTARNFVIPGTPDKDGVYAAALTALAEGDKVVKFCLTNGQAPVPGTTKGQVKLLQILLQ